MKNNAPPPQDLMTPDEAWLLFDSRRFLHGHRETMRDSFIIALKELFASPAPAAELTGANLSPADLRVAGIDVSHQGGLTTVVIHAEQFELMSRQPVADVEGQR